MATTATLTATYRVTSITEVNNGTNAASGVSVTFTEVGDNNTTAPNQFYGSFTRTFSAEEGAGFFPGQVYTMTLTKQS